MDDSIREEAIWEKLSEIGKKVDVVLSNTAKQSQASQETSEAKPSMTDEEMEAIVKKYAQGLGQFIKTEIHGREMAKLDSIQNSIASVKGQIERMPTPEPFSLEPIIQLFPKPKKVNICGFEFLRTSVIISALVLLSFISLTLNIKQWDDYHALENRHNAQNEYILHLQENQPTEPTVSKEKSKNKEKVKTKEMEKKQ